MKTIEVEFDEYPDAVYTLTVQPVSFEAFERIHAAYEAAATAFFATNIGPMRALAADFAAVAELRLGGDPNVPDDPNLTLALVRHWSSGVRNVPLPLPRGSSASDT